MTINNDQLYINKVIQGDNNSYAYLVNKYKDMVFTLALKIVKDREEAEEVAQDTFIKAFKSLSKFKGDAKFSTWLYKITYNNCMDVVKKQARRYNLTEIDEVVENKLESIENTLDTIEREERSRIMKECLEYLPEDEKTILWLFYFKELSLKEIQDVTSYTQANIKVKLHRARKRMLSIVKEKVEPEIIKQYGKS